MVVGGGGIGGGGAVASEGTLPEEEGYHCVVY